MLHSHTGETVAGSGGDLPALRVRGGSTLTAFLTLATLHHPNKVRRRTWCIAQTDLQLATRFSLSVNSKRFTKVGGRTVATSVHGPVLLPLCRTGGVLPTDIAASASSEAMPAAPVGLSHSTSDRIAGGVAFTAWQACSLLPEKTGDHA